MCNSDLSSSEFLGFCLLIPKMEVTLEVNDLYLQNISFLLQTELTNSIEMYWWY